jgi:hypothetical protein
MSRAGEGVDVMAMTSLRHKCSFCLAIAYIVISPSLMGGTVALSVPGGDVDIAVKSYMEIRFDTVVRQEKDFSCGSAAVATLLSYHYENEVTEHDAFSIMYERGDKAKINREGFSLLDIKNYLESNGYPADGFRVSLDKLAKVGVPAIALINHKGYKHFVVVKGVQKNKVLVADPAKGTKIFSRKEFERMWNGIFFIIRSKRDIAQQHFNNESEWKMIGVIPEYDWDRGGLAMFTLLLPRLNDF